MGEFTHFNQHGDAIMVDISKKRSHRRRTHLHESGMF